MNKIAELRKKIGLSQAELGKIVGAAQNTICNWENGNRKPDYETLIILSKLFNCSIEYIIGEDSTIKINTQYETITQQEKTLLETFRNTTEFGRQRIIQSALNIYDEIEKKNTRANTKNSG